MSNIPSENERYTWGKILEISQNPQTKSSIEAAIEKVNANEPQRKLTLETVVDAQTALLLRDQVSPDSSAYPALSFLISALSQ